MKAPAANALAAQQSSTAGANALAGTKTLVDAENAREYNAPRLTGDRNEPYATGAPDLYHGAKGRFERIPLASEDEPNAVAHVANVNGIEYLGRMSGNGPDEAARAVNGIHIAPDHLDALLHNVNIDAAQNASSALRHLQQIAQEAQQDRKSLIFVKDHVSVPETQRTAVLNEELNHAAQRAATGPLGSHLGSAAQSFLDGALASRAKQSLELGFGYQFRSPGQAAAEVGVRLMYPGAYRELGLSPGEGRALGAQYVQALEKEYGHAATAEISRRIADAAR